MLDSDALADLIAELIGDHVERATAPLIARICELESRLGAPSADDVRAMVADAVAAIPVPQDGKSVTLEDLTPVVTEAVDKAVAALPAPRDGESVDPAVVERMVADAVAAIPAPKDGKSVTIEDLTPVVAEAVDKAIAALPAPKDGESVDPAVVERMVADAVAEIPAPKDGVGVADAMIDRDGELALTLTDGSIRRLGVVVGRDADMAALERMLGEMVAAIPKPRDGFDLEDFDTKLLDDGRTLRLSFRAGDHEHSHELHFPVMIYRHVWREGESYKQGDVVTWGGSLWHADRETKEKPDTADGGWRLIVKRGRDGKDFQPKA